MKSRSDRFIQTGLWCASALLGVLTAACSYDLPGLCGNNRIDHGEECDEDVDLPVVCEQCKLYLPITWSFPDEPSAEIPEVVDGYTNGPDKPTVNEMACFTLDLKNYESNNKISDAKSKEYRYIHDVDVEVGADHLSVGELVVLVIVASRAREEGEPPAPPQEYAAAMRRPGKNEGSGGEVSIEGTGAIADITSDYPLSFRTCMPDGPDGQDCALMSAEHVGVGFDMPGDNACPPDDECVWKASSGDKEIGHQLADLKGRALWDEGGLRQYDVWRVCVHDTVVNESLVNESKPSLKSAKIRIRRRKTPSE